MLGESAGRSRRAPVTGRRRFDDDERSQLTHLHDDPQAWPDNTPQSRWREFNTPLMVAWMVLVGFGFGILLGRGL